ncbi:MAG TPA: HAD family hydrolase [Flavobacterium sp.]
MKIISFLDKKGELFAKTKIDKNLNPKIYSALLHHVNSNHDVYIVTASFFEWIEPWSQNHNTKVIGTKLEIINNKIAGEFHSKNCYGQEKLNRIKKIIDLSNFDNVYVYGSGNGDKEMLKLAKQTPPKINP